MTNYIRQKFFIFTIVTVFILLSVYQIRTTNDPFFIDRSIIETELEIESDIQYRKNLDSKRVLSEKIPYNLQQQRIYYKKPEQQLRSSAIFEHNDPWWVQLFYIPQIICPTQIRLGAIGDGGYTICNPWLLSKTNAPCITYSFGVGGSVSFETQLYELSGKKCQIHCFDEHPEPERSFKPFNGKFTRLTVANISDSSKNEYTMLDLIRSNKHDKIDILKVDIEGAEFSTLASFIRSYQGTVCHLLLELHANKNEDISLWRRLFRMLARRGFLLYDKEVTVYFTHFPLLHQYSYIHFDCLQDYDLSQDSIFLEYFR